MIIENIVGNVATLEKRAPHIEYVYLESEQLVKRIQRMKTDHGNELGIRLSKNEELSDGDVLYMDEKNMVVISVKKDDVLVISPTTMKQMGDTAHQLGNRHLPAQFEGEDMIVQYDYLIEELLLDLGVPHKRENRKVPQPFRYIGHHHD
ncbi:urease accessory protein UreE [Halobacillus halophilus]|uniref:Urease accessory protein UreE n=1 Tax=Halobacillus halophilus (strain ATCC 35676 / DSM 2266 / JCM 20832 / KCTC 3685 / LMG 17431 / NBRC 102448 / NCIMB 2269) TaxID=866895 RepID=I0JR93_HALH3|nr:urease accessory protein UreE [Halobacillus halophilus]ASF40649.1 urease accessory protein UreE [Halobacillus halophilus]CCG46663.1 urease accessory protein UreE [Halobacillus halophilus DSM 2266]